MIGGLVVAAVASITFIIPLPIEWLIVLRVVQGFGFAAVIPAKLAAVADVVPRAKLGRAYGWVLATRRRPSVESRRWTMAALRPRSP